MKDRSVGKVEIKITGWIAVIVVFYLLVRLFLF